MAAASVAGLRLRDDVQAGLPAFEGYLALGATDRQAGLEFGRRATGRTLLPGLDQTNSAGLVTLPWAFVGLLIGGATPLLAAQIQLLVLVGLLLAQTVAGVLTTRLIRPVARPRSAAASTGHPVLSGPADPSAGIALVDVGVSYGSTTAVDKVSVDIAGPGVTVLVGPSGCGKSSLLREMNRMNDAVADARSSGVVLFRGQNVQETDAVELRRAVGMVFQRPNVFPSSIRDNVAYGPRLRAIREGVDDLVRECLVRAALWEEVKDRLDDPASSLSIGQQQRLTIGRCLALDPEVILMDEPTSALDPVATEQIELLIRDLGRDHLVVVTSHNRDQIRRIADHIVYVDRDPTDASRPARLIEHGTAERLLSDPRDARTRAFLQAH